MRNFKELKVWEKGMALVVEIYRVTAELPSDERFGLISQLNRAAVSVPSNIAEGCSRGSNAGFIQFLEYALGSVFEIETQLLLVERLNLAPKERLENVLAMVDEQGKMLNGLITSIR